MTSESKPRSTRLVELIARMPKDVRSEVQRLDEEVEELHALLAARGAQNSRITLAASARDLPTPLPEDARIRFHGPPGKNPNSSNYIEFFIAYEGAKRNAVDVRCGSGRLIVHPGASNCVTLIEGDL